MACPPGELTALGRSLLPPIEAFGEWAVTHGDEVLAAQDRWEGAEAAGPAPRLVSAGVAGLTRVTGSHEGEAVSGVS